MITEWMKNRNAQLSVLKQERDGAYMELDEHRGKCPACNESSVDKILKSQCQEGVVAARRVDKLNKQMAGERV